MNEEIKFLRLPSIIELEHQAERTMENGKLPQTLRERYVRSQWQVYRAQRRAAVVAVEVCRPTQARQLKQEYRFRVEEARAKFEDGCVNEFSEYCTKGLK